MGVRMLRGCQTSRGCTCPEDLSTYSGHLHKGQPVSNSGGAHLPAGSGRPLATRSRSADWALGRFPESSQRP